MAKGSTSGIVTAYLFLYNIVAGLGWAWVLVICAKHIADGSVATLWDEVEIILKVVQTMAVMEILHAIVGLVKSPWHVTFMQVFSRVWTLWAVMDVARDAQISIFTVLACTSWGLVEVPRYLFYALNLINAVPYPLFWLRYSLFAILYPTGITGEVGCMYLAGLWLYNHPEKIFTPIAAAPALELPGTVLFGLIVLVVVTYIPGSPFMYLNMVKTRKSQFKSYKAKKSE